MNDREQLAYRIGRHVEHAGGRSTRADSLSFADEIAGEAGWRPPVKVIETDEDLATEVPDGSIVRSKAGTIACRFDYGTGVVFGDDRPFPWGSLQLPVTVLWSPPDPTEESR